jgi:hypothetical protein
MMLEVGKLYSCEDYFLMFYPDKDTARAGAAAAAARLARAADAAFWTRRLRKPVSYLEKNISLLVLNMEENFVEVLAGDKKGWIIYEGWLKFREIV